MVATIKKLKRFLVGIFLQFFFRVGSKMPFFVLRFIGRKVGYLVWYFDLSYSRISRTNLHLCYPKLRQRPAELEDLVRKNTESIFQSVAETAYIWGQSWPALSCKVTHIYGESLLKKCINERQGLLLLAPHLSSWELFCSYIGQLTTVYAMYRPSKYKLLDQFIKKRREKTGIFLQPITISGIKMIARHLKKGGTAIFLPDQEPSYESGVFVPLFGVDHVLTPSLPAKLVQKTGCKVLMVSVVRESNGKFAIHIQDANPEIYNSNLSASVQSMNGMLERCISEAPDQYIWGYKRFKNGIDGKRYLYKTLLKKYH